MTDRQKQILSLVIQEYIDTGTPVSSKVLANKYRLSFSPATLRSELYRLCEEGYLVQPHTSAGRVPSDKGYRFYIKNAMNPQPLSSTEKLRIQKELFGKKEEPGRNIARAISFETRSLGVYFDLAEEILYKEGLVEIFKSPDLKESHEIVDFVEFFEDLEDRINNIFDTIWDEQYNIFIGREHFFSSLDEFSLLCSGYNLEGRDYVLGAIGPKRMDYARNISVLDFIKNEIMGQNL